MWSQLSKALRILPLLMILLLLGGCEGLFETDEGISAAVKARDPNMCAQLEEDESGTRIDTCFERVATRIKDPKVCNRIQTTDNKDGCFSGIAVSTRDGKLCEKVVESDERNECYSDVSAKTHDTTLCDKIDSVYATDQTECITTAATGKKDTEVCLKLERVQDQHTCMSQVARNTRDFDTCAEITDTNYRLSCEKEVAVSTGKVENCKKIKRESTREACEEQINARRSGIQATSCSTEADCKTNEACIDSTCVVPQCTRKTRYCRGDSIEYCQSGRLYVETCIYGCFENECLTKEEGKKKEKKPGCDEGITKCISDTAYESCESGKVVKHLCEFGCKRGACKEEEVEDLSGAISKMKDKQEFAEVVSGPYMKALDLAIGSEEDESRKAGLEAYKKFLGGSADAYGKTIATLEDLEKLKKIFVDEYDPSMNIENMDAGEILQKGLGTKIKDAVKDLWPFGNKKSVEQLEQEQAEDQLKVYTAMLERKKEIEFLKKSRLSRVGDTMAGMVKDKVSGKVKEKAEDLAKNVGGKAFATVGILGQALDTVQDEAQNMMFTGLIKAYNRRRVVLEEQYPSKSNEDIHVLTVKQVEEFPYADAKTGVVIAKYGNLLENEDCTKKGNSNPLCIDRHAFWVSMEKSYEHVNSKKLYDRWLKQMKEE